MRFIFNTVCLLLSVIIFFFFFGPSLSSPENPIDTKSDTPDVSIDNYTLRSEQELNTKRITREGYYYQNGNRVFNYSFAEDVSEQEIKEHAFKHTPIEKRMTAAYYFNKGMNIPGDEISKSTNIIEVNDILYDSYNVSSWRYAYMREYIGEERFINCIENKNNDLCRE